MLVFVCYKLKENYKNLRIIFDLIGVWDVKCRLIGDLLVQNIYCGMQPHSATFACFCCDVDKDNLHLKGNPRTIQSLIDNYKAYKEAKCERTELKRFFNVENEPLLLKPFDKMGTDEKHDEEFLGQETSTICVLPQLHLFLGAFNHPFTLLKKILPDIEVWPKECHITVQPRHGEVYNGNDSKTLLKNLHILEKFLGEKELKFQSFVVAFRALDNVTKSCFSAEVGADFEKDLEDFRKFYLALNEDFGLSISFKIHMIMHHVGDWLKREQIGLGVFSEQGLESCHSKFKNFIKNRKTNPKVAKQVLSAVVAFNSQNI